MPRIGNIQQKDFTREVGIEFDGGEVLTVVVYPHRLTRARQEALQELDDDDQDGFAGLFFDIIESWDLEDDKGQILPFTAETVALLSMPTMLRLMDGILEAVRPKSKTSPRSRGR